MPDEDKSLTNYVHEACAAATKVMRARDMVESLILGRKMYLPDPADPNTSVEKLRELSDPTIERMARTIILEGNLEECVETFIMGYDLLANSDWIEKGRHGECPHVKREELEWDRQTLDDLFLVQYVEWMEKVFVRLESERPKIGQMKLSPEALAQYDELVRETPVPGMSNEELVAMVKPEEVEDTLRYLMARAKSIKILRDRGLLRPAPAV